MRSGNRRCIALLAAAMVALAGVAMATPAGFTEDFTGPTLDPAWVPGSYAAGHIGIVGGSYYMTAKQGGGFNPKLQRFDTGNAEALNSYTHEISVVLNPFGLTGGGGTQSDFKWKTFGPDGFMEIVLNSFGDMRLYHNDSDGGGGNIQPNTNIGIADGDVLGLTVDYNAGSDTLDVTYSLNGGAAMPFYSGGGVDGPVDDLISNFVEVEVFKWGEAIEEPYAAIDEWNLEVIPEPSMIALFGIGGLALMVSRRRK